MTTSTASVIATTELLTQTIAALSEGLSEMEAEESVIAGQMDELDTRRSILSQTLRSRRHAIAVLEAQKIAFEGGTAPVGLG